MAASRARASPFCSRARAGACSCWTARPFRATYLKDPITGFGIGDAVTQALLLAEALGSCLDGAEWEETMRSYQAKRDEVLLPLYELTLDAVDRVAPPAEALDPLRAA